MQSLESEIRDEAGDRLVPIKELETLPLDHREIISSEQLDSMDHMNIRWYQALYDTSAWNFFAAHGMNEAYFRKAQSGMFALKHFIQYFSEVRSGHSVALRIRMLGRSDKRLYFMIFMINETTGQLASTLEALGTHVDLKTRQSCPIPPEISGSLDAKLKKDQELDWQAPVCGAIKL